MKEWREYHTPQKARERVDEAFRKANTPPPLITKKPKINTPMKEVLPDVHE